MLPLGWTGIDRFAGPGWFRSRRETVGSRRVDPKGVVTVSRVPPNRPQIVDPGAGRSSSDCFEKVVQSVAPPLCDYFEPIVSPGVSHVADQSQAVSLSHYEVSKAYSLHSSNDGCMNTRRSGCSRFRHRPRGASFELFGPLDTRFPYARKPIAWQLFLSECGL